MLKWLLMNSIAYAPETESGGDNEIETSTEDKDGDEWQIQIAELKASIQTLSEKLESVAGRPDQAETVAALKAELSALRTELTELKSKPTPKPRKTPKPPTPNNPAKSGEDDPPVPAGHARRKLQRV